MQRQPFAEVAGNASSNARSPSPSKVFRVGQQEQSYAGCTLDSVVRNAGSVIAALEAEVRGRCLLPPSSRPMPLTTPKHPVNSGVHLPCWRLRALQGSHIADALYPAPPRSALHLQPAAAASSSPRVDTVPINRLASEVAASEDVVSAWEQVETLRGQLRQKDAELAGALEALEAAQQQQLVLHDGAGAGALQHRPAEAAAPRPPSAGQQLAQFLKDQLAERDSELEAAHRQVAAAQQQLLVRAREQAATEAAAAAAVHRAQQAEAAAQHLEARLEAADHDRATLEQELAATRGGCWIGLCVGCIPTPLIC